MPRVKKPGADEKMLVQIPLTECMFNRLDEKCREDVRSRTKMLEALVRTGVRQYESGSKLNIPKRDSGEKVLGVWTRLDPETVSRVNELAADDDRPRTAFLSRLVSAMLTA